MVRDVSNSLKDIALTLVHGLANIIPTPATLMIQHKGQHPSQSGVENVTLDGHTSSPSTILVETPKLPHSEAVEEETTMTCMEVEHWATILEGDEAKVPMNALPIVELPHGDEDSDSDPGSKDADYASEDLPLQHLGKKKGGASIHSYVVFVGD
ncbi:unnamed protein product [Sphagnum balticum]